MKEICVTYEQMANDYPELLGRFINELSYSNIDVKIDEMDLFYYWTLENNNNPMEEYKHMLKFHERLDYELSKVQIEIYVRFGTYIRGEITSSLEKPQIVIDELSKLLVTTMKYEQSIYMNKDVEESIPVDIEPYKEIEDLLKPTKMLQEPLEEYDTLDDILDKITKHGYDRLTDNEKDILDRLSKE